jgi:hypothetical protein
MMFSPATRPTPLWRPFATPPPAEIRIRPAPLYPLAFMYWQALEQRQPCDCARCRR